MRADWRARLDAELEASQGYKANSADWLDGRWADIKAARDYDDPRRGQTGVAIETLKEIGEKITAAPKGFHVHRTIQRFLDARAKAIKTGEGIDWATGEALAFCSLLLDGHPVRLSGQDTERGTFSQRHSVLVDQENEDRYIPFNHVRRRARPASRSSTRCSRRRRCSASNTAIRSPSPMRSPCGRRSSAISPTARRWCSTSSSPRASASGCACRAWSACCRTATKGRGRSTPRRGSSAILQMCAEDNMQVANCTTPANYFHILRRQLKRDIRKPLILMTPKIAAAPQARGVAARRDGAGHHVPSPAVGRRAAAARREDQARRRRQDPARGDVLGQGLLRSLRGAREARHRRRLSAAGRAALSGAAQGAGAGARPLPQGASSCGARRSRATWAPTRSWSPISNGCSTSSAPSAGSRSMPAGRPSAATATGQMSQHLKQLKALLDEALG